MTTSRMFMNIVVDDPRDSAAFYQEVFGLVRQFDSAWFVHLGSLEHAGLELGLLQRQHPVVPPELGEPGVARIVLTLVVESSDEIHERAVARGAESLQAPRDLFYGQRRAVVRSPDGTLLDISSPCSPDAEWVRRVSQSEDGAYVESPE